jgi:glycosyltransferase involved in cell wall biosynthesis
MKIDIIVCTKDRPDKLLNCVPKFKAQIPHDNFTVYEGSQKPCKQAVEVLEQQEGVTFRYVPKKLFGAVRKDALVNSDADYIAMVDDDIELSAGWFNGLMSEFNDPSVVAVSSRLVFCGEPISNKLSKANTRTSGGSGGAAIYKRKAIVELGNFNGNIHRGEDMELELRIQGAGKKWLKSQKVTAYHPIRNIQEFLGRPNANVVGWEFILQHSSHKYRFLATRFASIFVMPIYYFWKTGDLRASGVWFIFKMKALLSFLSGRYQK